MADIPEGATASIADRWSDEFETAVAAYNQGVAALSLSQHRRRVTDRQVAKYLDDRDAALWDLIRARTPRKWMLIEKMYILLQLMTDNDWTDRRDLILAASVLRDIEQMEQAD